MSCTSRARAHALLEAAAHQALCYGHRKLIIHGLDSAHAVGTNLAAIEFDYRPGTVVLDPSLAGRELEWPFEVRQAVLRIM